MTFLRLACFITGGHRWNLVDRWEDGATYSQCNVCCQTRYIAQPNPRENHQ